MESWSRAPLHEGIPGEGAQAPRGVAREPFVGDEGLGLGLAEPGHGPGDPAPLAQQGRPERRDGIRTQRAGDGRRAEAAACGGRGTAQGERDPDDGIGFFAARLDPTRR